MGRWLKISSLSAAEIFFVRRDKVWRSEVSVRLSWLAGLVQNISAVAREVMKLSKIEHVLPIYQTCISLKLVAKIKLFSLHRLLSLLCKERSTNINRDKKITCPGARDKSNFRQDKHIFSPNVRWASKKFSASLFDDIFRTSYLATGQVKI